MLYQGIESLERRTLFSVDVTIDPSQSFQTIDGFGAYAPPYSPEISQMFYQDFGARTVRVAVAKEALRAAGDNAYGVPVTPVTLGDDLNANVALFNFAASDRLNNMVSIVKDSLKYTPGTKVVGSIWTPPHWMKTTEIDPWTGQIKDGDANTPGVQPVVPTLGYGNSESGGGSLIDTSENITQFARYVAAYVTGWQKATGVPIYAISLQNEPAFHEPYDSCVYSGPLFAKVVAAVGKEFAKWGIQTKIAGPEDVGAGAENFSETLDRQLMYIDAIRANPDAKAALDMYTIHGFATDKNKSGRSPIQWDKYWTAIKDDGLDSWMVETSGESQTWTGAFRLAWNIQDELVHGNINGFVYWQFVDGGPPDGFNLTSGLDTTGIKYVAAKHFSKFILPGMTRIAAGPSDDYGVYVSAFEKGTSLTSVLMNLGSTEQTVTLHYAAGKIASINADMETTGTVKWVDAGATLADGDVTVVLPASSLVTIAATTQAVGGWVKGTVYNDANGNRSRGASEAGLAGRVVYFDANNNAKLDAGELQTTTDSRGAYTLLGVPAGADQIIRQVLPTGWEQTSPTNNWGLHANVSNGSRINGKDFGAKQVVFGSISGKVIDDRDGDGKLESGEPGIAGRTVYNDANNNGILDAGEIKTVTDSTGSYKLSNLGEGAYKIRQVVPAGSNQTAPSKGFGINITLGVGTNATGKSFGVFSNTVVRAAVRVNAGGGDYRFTTGAFFDADRGFTGGTVLSTPYTVGNTSNSTLYYTVRVGTSFSYALAAADGAYKLTLYFVDGISTAAGQNKFDVTAEGTKILSGYDVYAHVGPKSAATKTFDVTVSGGQLDLLFSSIAGSAMVSAIELVPV